MMRLIGVALAALLCCQASLAKESPEEIANDLEYTLVQFIDDTTCEGKRYVCQPVTKGQTNIFYTHERHGNDKICAKLLQNDTDATFRIDSCIPTGPDCPEECGCYEMQPKLVLDQCYGDTLHGHGKMATMLVKGKMPNCIKSTTSHKMDIDMARYCNKWPSVKGVDYTKRAEAAGVAEKALLAQGSKQSKLRMRRQQHNQPMTMNANDLPEQGFSGQEVDHVNQETYTQDWGQEYGPNMPGAPKPQPKPKKSAAASGLVMSLSSLILASFAFLC